MPANIFSNTWDTQDLEPGSAAIENVRKLLSILTHDSERMIELDNYKYGRHEDPYTPVNADYEYKQLAERSITNMMPLMVNSCVQSMYVDAYEPGDSDPRKAKAAWEHWQRSRLDANQSSVYDGSFSYGHSFVITEIDERVGKSVSRGLSAMVTAALYEDPTNDIAPVCGLHVKRWSTKSGETSKPGLAYYWDDKFKWQVIFTQGEPGDGIVMTPIAEHGSSECPLTRFPASIDLEGRTIGIIEPLIVLQNRINQTTFDLLMAQTAGSFQVRWATGMAPPLEMKPIFEKDINGAYVLDDEGNRIIQDIIPRLDDNGQPIPKAVNLNASKFMFAEDPNVKFGAIPGSPLEGYISSLEMSIKQLSALSQTPPHYLLGQIANLSAEALQAAETSLHRKIQKFKTVFGECWERVFWIAMEMDQITEGPNMDYSGEVKWRDLDNASLAKAADALNKLKEIEVPREGLWEFIPGVTQTQMDRWRTMVEEDPEAVLATALRNTANAMQQQASADISPAVNTLDASGEPLQ